MIPFKEKNDPTGREDTLPTIPVGEEGMQFCKDCGGVLNLFGKDDREICPACIQNRKQAPPPVPASNDGDVDLLNRASLSFENGKIILRSKEGWELWSSAPGMKTELKTVLAHARRIYAIRLRRQKN